MHSFNPYGFGCDLCPYVLLEAAKFTQRLPWMKFCLSEHKKIPKRLINSSASPMTPKSQSENSGYTISKTVDIYSSRLSPRIFLNQPRKKNKKQELKLKRWCYTSRPKIWPNRQRKNNGAHIARHTVVANRTHWLFDSPCLLQSPSTDHMPYAARIRYTSDI